jgi:hypothetical protein
VCDIQVTDPLEASEAATSERFDSPGLPDNLQLVRTLELGTVVVIEALWEQLGIGKDQRRYILGSLEYTTTCSVSSIQYISGGLVNDTS